MDDAAAGVELVAPMTLEALVDAHGGAPDADLRDRVVRRVVSPEQASADDDLVVVTQLRSTAVASSAPGVLLCQTDVASRVAAGARWVHPHAMHVVATLLAPVARRGEPSGVEPTAWIDPTAAVDRTAVVCRGAVIRAGALVGAGCVIGEGAVIYGGVRLGRGVVVGPLAVVGRPGFGWATGPSGAITRIPQLGGVVVEDDVEIGPLCTVDAGTLGPTILRRGVKLDAHVHVGHNVVVGAHTLVAAQAGFAGSVRIGSGVLVGGQAGVTDHAVVGDGARIAAKSGVIGDVPVGAVVAGYPAVPRVSWLRAWATLLHRGHRRSS